MAGSGPRPVKIGEVVEHCSSMPTSMALETWEPITAPQVALSSRVACASPHLTEYVHCVLCVSVPLIHRWDKCIKSIHTYAYTYTKEVAQDSCGGRITGTEQWVSGVRQ